jgi:hypothetical protein
MEPRETIKKELDMLGLKLEDVEVWGLLMQEDGVEVLHREARLGAWCKRIGHWKKRGRNAEEVNLCPECSWHDFVLSVPGSRTLGRVSASELARTFKDIGSLLTEAPRSWRHVSDVLEDLEREKVPTELVTLRFGALDEVRAKACVRLGTELLEWVHQESLSLEVRDFEWHASNWGFAGKLRAEELMKELLAEVKSSMTEPDWIVVDVEDCETTRLDPLERAVLEGAHREGRLIQLPDAFFRRLDKADKIEDCLAVHVGERLGEHDFEALGKLYDFEGDENYHTPEAALEVLRAL